MMKKQLFPYLLLLLGTLSNAHLHAQVHNDGPMIVKARLRHFNPTFAPTDAMIFGAPGIPDDNTYYIWGRDLPDVDLVTANGGWDNGSGCLTEFYDTGYTPTNFDSVFFSQVYPTAQTPHAVEIRTYFWEDETPDQINGIGCAGTRCAYETNFCCGGILFGSCMGIYEGDDYPCNSGTTPYATLDFRLGAPGQWYSHGPVGGNCANNVYFPTIETFYRNAFGEDCNSPIAFGNLSPGFSPVSHANAIDGYTNDITYANGGRDVVYSFTLTQPMWIDISTCGTGTCPTDVVLLSNTCTVLQSSSSTCGNGTTLSQAFCNPGTYYVAVEARNNAPTGTFTITLSQSSSPMLSMSAGPDVPTCPGTPVTIGPGIPPSGGLAPYTYTWSPPTGLSSPVVMNPMATSLTPQQYILTVTDANGCTRSDTMQLTMLGGAPFSLGQDTVVCPGAPITLTGPSGGGTYAWSTGANTSSIQVSTPGQYALTVTTNGCQFADTILINAGTATAPSLPADTAICPDTSVVIAAVPGMAGYLWSGGATSASITVAQAGSYSVTVTDAIGCTSTDAFNLSLIPDCVFPGDVDHDGDCDLTDALHLSALYGTAGLPRSAATTGWYGQVAPDWVGSYMGINHKHADSDGDALANAADTTAIHLNFGRIHTRVGTITSGPVVLRLVPQSVAVLAGTMAKFDLYLEGAGGGSIDSVLGLAFKAHWNPSGMATPALNHADFSACWFATPGNQMNFTHVMAQEDGFVVARNNGTMVSGNGLVGTLSFLTSSALPSGQPFYFVPDLREVEVMAADHSLRTVQPQGDSIFVTDTLLALPTGNLGSISIYPNPANETATILLSPNVETLQIIGSQGNLLQEIAVGGKRQLLLSLQGIPSGMLMLCAVGPGGTAVRKLQVMH
ncbi:MAG: T9SS type A sorting domain-containing protein [Bacteroidia bacterium]